MKFSLFIGVLVFAQSTGAYGQGTYTPYGANFSGAEQLLAESASGPIAHSYLNEADTAETSVTLCSSSCDCGSGCAGNVKSGCCGHKFSWGDDTYVTVGAGLRLSYNAIEGGNQAPSNSGTRQDFSVNNARLYVNGQGHKRIGFEFNTDINGAQGFDYHGGSFGSQNTGEMRILDAVLKFQLTDHIHLWTGRMLPPSDRSNLSGPFYANVWNFPFAQFGYPNIFQGRDDGAALWGEYGGGVFKWQAGVFEGESTGSPFVNGHPGKDNLMFSGRVVLNLLDPEPGYYNSSTYYGAKDILAIGATVMHRSDAQDNIAATDYVDFTGWSIDALFEKKLSNRGVVTLEGAYYDFNDNDGETSGAAITLPPSGNNRQGESYFVLSSYLFPRKCCLLGFPGQFQVSGRYQRYDRDTINGGGGGKDEQTDAQINYIMFGHNARISGVWSQLDIPGSANIDTFTIGTQVQF
ncbi:MAG: porin [Pirellulales bacterium]